jgi:hypothetical protein
MTHIMIFSKLNKQWQDQRARHFCIWVVSTKTHIELGYLRFEPCLQDLKCPRGPLTSLNPTCWISGAKFFAVKQFGFVRLMYVGVLVALMDSAKYTNSVAKVPR